MLGVKLFGVKPLPAQCDHSPARHQILCGRRRRHGKDHTLFALRDGRVSFKTGFKRRTFVSWSGYESGDEDRAE